MGQCCSIDIIQLNVNFLERFLPFRSLKFKSLTAENVKRCVYPFVCLSVLNDTSSRLKLMD